MICRTSRFTLCGKSCDLERKYLVFATPVSQKRRRQPISFILDSLSAQMNVPDTKFPRNTMKLLNHNASTLKTQTVALSWYTLGFFFFFFFFLISFPEYHCVSTFLSFTGYYNPNLK